MSIGATVVDSRKLARRRTLAAAGFVTLLALSVWWPSPAVSMNRLWLHEPMAVDELSFLGREAPSWDAAFWCVAGLFLLALLHPSDTFAFSDFREVTGELRQVPAALRAFGRRSLGRLRVVAGIAAFAAVVALVWRLADASLTAWAESIQCDAVDDAIRLVNRLGGGMNPALVVIFFTLAGVTCRDRRWVRYGVAMAFAGAIGGLLAQMIKFAAGRTRPELWLGPFQHARVAATSFPSGHTVGAFAIAGVLIFSSSSRSLRLIAFALAASVGLARILAFRHWTSDVVASALIGLFVAWVFTRAIVDQTSS